MTAPGFRPRHDGFTVDPDELAARAAAVDALAERMRQAVSRAMPVDPSAYGLIGQVYAGPAATAVAMAATAVGALADDVAGAAGGLRGCREGYLIVEQAATTRFLGIGP